MTNYLFTARAEFESWPKPAVSHDDTLLGQVVDEAKSAVTADGMDPNTFVDPKVNPKMHGTDPNTFVDPKVNPKVHAA